MDENVQVPQIGTYEWRRMHCETGDMFLAMADQSMLRAATTSADARRDATNYAIIAQAHYAAANVRYRP